MFFVTGATSLGRVFNDTLELYRVTAVRTASFRSPDLLKELVSRVGSDTSQSNSAAAQLNYNVHYTFAFQFTSLYHITRRFERLLYIPYLQQSLSAVIVDDESVAGIRRHLSDGDFYFALPVPSVSAPLVPGLNASERSDADPVPYWDLTLHLQRYALTKDVRHTNEDFLWYATDTTPHDTIDLLVISKEIHYDYSNI